MFSMKQHMNILLWKNHIFLLVCSQLAYGETYVGKTTRISRKDVLSNSNIHKKQNSYSWFWYYSKYSWITLWRLKWPKNILKWLFLSISIMGISKPNLIIILHNSKKLWLKKQRSQLFYKLHRTTKQRSTY